MRVVAQNISKSFNGRRVLSEINFEIASGESLAITGPNGSGKTTLIKIICGLIAPSTGQIQFYSHKKLLTRDELYNRIGLVGPYLQLYNYLTAWENIQFFSRIRGIEPDTDYFLQLMDRLGLRGREADELRTYSSGMLQRMKYVIALLHQPEVLILDEPTANVDEEGSRVIYQIMEMQMSTKILILATNEPEEVKFGKRHVRVDS